MKLLIDECILGKTAKLLKGLKPADIEKSLIIVDRNKYRIRK